MNKRDTGFRKRACKKRAKQNCHLFWKKIISKLPRQYTHMITRDTTYETIFFFLLQNTRRDCCLLILSLVYIILLVLNLSTAIRRMDNLGAVPALRCFLFLPLIVVSELQLQFCWSAVSKWSYDVRAFGLNIVLFEYHLFSVLSGNWNLLPKKIASVWKRNGYPKFIKSRVETN